MNQQDRALELAKERHEHPLSKDIHQYYANAKEAWATHTQIAKDLKLDPFDVWTALFHLGLSHGYRALPTAKAVKEELGFVAETHRGGTYGQWHRSKVTALLKEWFSQQPVLNDSPTA